MLPSKMPERVEYEGKAWHVSTATPLEQVTLAKRTYEVIDFDETERGASIFVLSPDGMEYVIDGSDLDAYYEVPVPEEGENATRPPDDGSDLDDGTIDNLTPDPSDRPKEQR